MLLAWIFWQEDFRTRTANLDCSASRMAGGGVSGGRRGNLVGVRWGIFLEFLACLPGTSFEFRCLFFNHFLSGLGGDAVKVVWFAARSAQDSRVAFRDHGSHEWLRSLILCRYLHAFVLRLAHAEPQVAGLMHAVFSIFSLSLHWLFFLSS